MTIEPDVPLTWGAQLARAERILAGAGAATPRDDAIELLSSLLGAPASLLPARPANLMSQPDAETYAGWVSRRAAGEALPHITGRLPFMGLELAIRRGDPLPAPGAWRLVETALWVARRHTSGDLLAADIWTGCGATALALVAFEPRFIRLYAVDPSVMALETAEANGARYLLNLVISWQVGEGPASVPEPVDVMLCGQLDQRALAVTRLLEAASVKLRPGGALICGLNREPVHEVRALLQRALPTAYVWTDSQPGGAVLVAQLPRASTSDMTFNPRTRGGIW
jgi:SAM-dependent methyltransferase